jgi:hypothetical protein
MFFLVVWLVSMGLVTSALVAKVHFTLHITPTGLHWREFREHELPYHCSREVRIAGGDRMGDQELIIRGPRRADTLRLSFTDVRRADRLAIVAAVQRAAPHLVLDERSQRLLQRDRRRMRRTK